MDINRCAICGWYGVDKLCKKHQKEYIWDSSIQAYRLRKRLRGSRYTKLEYHKSEIQLTKIIEKFYGPSDVCTSVHPIWAISKKGVLFEFDIYIKSKNIFIEYNSIIHYEYTKFFHNDYTTFREQKARDAKKKCLAKKNNCLLIIITDKEPLLKNYIINKIEAKWREFNG